MAESPSTHDLAVRTSGAGAPSAKVSTAPGAPMFPAARPIRDGIRAALFLLALVTPLGAMVLHLEHGPRISENRRLAERPKLELRPRALVKFPEKFRLYFTDSFGFRDALIHLHALFCLRVFGVLPNPEVIQGKGDWLFLAGERSTDDYRHTDLFTDAQLEQWRLVLEERRSWLAARGAAFVFVVAPNKQTIYGENMPPMLTQMAPLSRLDQLIAYLRARSTIQIVDVRPALIAGKGEERLYQKTDTHWNDRGAFRAYQTILEAVRASTPSAQLLPWDRFERTERDTAGMDLSRMVGMIRELPERRLELTPHPALVLRRLEQDESDPIEIPQRGTSLPSVVVFRDSFFTPVVPWLAESFGEGLYLWQDEFPVDAIEKRRPKVVIEEIVERKLMRLTPSNPQLPAAP